MNQSQSAESMQQSPEVAEKQKDQQEKTPEKASRSKQEASVCVREFLQQNEAKLENSVINFV